VTELAFTRPQTYSTDLAFGEVGGPVEYIDLTLTAVLHSAPLVGSLAVDIDNAVLRAPTARLGAGWQNADPASHQVAEVQHRPAGYTVRTAVPLAEAKSLPADRVAGWGLFDHLTASPASLWRAAVPKVTVTGEFWTNLNPRLRPGLRAVFEAGTPLQVRDADRWISLSPLRRPSPALPWKAARPVRVRASNPFSPAVRQHRSTVFPWGEAGHAAAGVSPHDTGSVTPPEPPCYTPPAGNAVALLFREVQANSTGLSFKCSRGTPPAVVVVPVQRTYIVINSANLRRVDGNTELPCYSLSLQLDRDSWTWGFSASLHASALTLVEPSEYGTPVELDAEINGNHYRLFAESISRDRQFGDSKINITGRGRSAVLSDPYAPIRNFTNVGALTAQQLINDVLTDNGVPIGWGVDFALDDWTIPAGVFAHRGTYVSAVNEIVRAAGGYVQPDPVTNTLFIKPAYPVEPWNLGAATPDYELPADITSREGIVWADRPNYNGVYVSGASDGVLALVRRAGSAGDVLAPMVVDSLITEGAAARQRGISVLGNTGRVAEVTLELPVLPATGVIVPGKIVRYLDGSAVRTGITRSVSVNVALPRISQQILVETHV